MYSTSKPPLTAEKSPCSVPNCSVLNQKLSDLSDDCKPNLGLSINLKITLSPNKDGPNCQILRRHPVEVTPFKVTEATALEED